MRGRACAAWARLCLFKCVCVRVCARMRVYVCVCVRICAWQVAMGVKWPIDWGYSSECHLCRCYLVERQSYKTRHDNGGELFEGQSTSDTLSYGNCVCNHVIIWCHTFATKLSITDVPLCLIHLRECFIVLIEIISLHIVKATCPHGKIKVQDSLTS